MTTNKWEECVVTDVYIRLVEYVAVILHASVLIA